jgi:hypothetical protein
MSAGRRNSRTVEGSCRECRTSRVKCDLKTPSCGRCERSAKECNYGPPPKFRWVGGTALRGRNAPPRSVEDATGGRALSAFSVQPCEHPLDPESMALYFSNAILPRFQLLDEGISLNPEEILGSTPLKQAVIAVSRAHLDISSHATSKDAIAVRNGARLTAIHGLRKELQDRTSSFQTAKRLFIVNVLLCMLDGMVAPSEDQPEATVLHLKGGYAMLSHWSTMPMALIAQGGLPAHLLSVFATMDLVHALLSGDKPFFDALTWNMFAGVLGWWGNLPPGDRFLTLFKSLSEMATLGHLVSSTLPQEVGLELARRCLPDIEATIYNSSATNETSLVPHAHWHTFCHLYELTAKIYLRRALQCKPVDDIDVQDATKKGVSLLVGEFALPGMMAHCIVLPLLVLGAHTLQEDEQRIVLDSLAPTASYLSFGSLSTMQSFLLNLWSRDTTTGWWDTFRPISDKVFLF